MILEEENMLVFRFVFHPEAKLCEKLGENLHDHQGKRPWDA